MVASQSFATFVDVQVVVVERRASLVGEVLVIVVVNKTILVV